MLDHARSAGQARSRAAWLAGVGSVTPSEGARGLRSIDIPDPTGQGHLHRCAPHRCCCTGSVKQVGRRAAQALRSAVPDRSSGTSQLQQSFTRSIHQIADAVAIWMMVWDGVRHVVVLACRCRLLLVVARSTHQRRRTACVHSDWGVHGARVGSYEHAHTILGVHHACFSVRKRTCRVLQFTIRCRPTSLLKASTLCETTMRRWAAKLMTQSGHTGGAE